MCDAAEPSTIPGSALSAVDRLTDETLSANATHTDLGSKASIPEAACVRHLSAC